MIELVTVTARIRTCYNSSPKEGKRLSKKQLHAQGAIDIYEILDGKTPDIEYSNIACSFIGKNKPPIWFSRGKWVQLTGHFSELTKRTKIFNIIENKSFLLSVEAAEKILSQKGINTDQQRKKALENGYTSLNEAIEHGAASPDIMDLYTQDIACINNLLHTGGFKYDIEMAYQLSTYFSRRAKIRGYENVSTMLTENPWLLSELDEFKLADVKKAVNMLNPRLAKEVPIYAEMTSLVTGASRKGHSYQPLNHLAYTLMASLLHSYGYSKKQYSYYLCNLAQTLPEKMPHHALSRLVVSGKNDYGEEAGKYYTENYAKNDIENASYWGKQSATGIYLARAYFSEKDAAEILAGMIQKHTLNYHPTDLNLINDLDKEQQQAVKNALHYRVSALIGYAGTGKTYTISRLLQILKRNNYRAIVLAPSAIAAQIAAKKTSECSHYATIHRYARILPEMEDLGEYGINQENRFGNQPHDVIIVDEAGMCDLPTFAALLHAIKNNPHIHLVLVGDTAQLPSIGPSGFFQQIASGQLEPKGLPITRLSEKNIYRSGDELIQFNTLIRQGAKIDTNQFNSIYENELTRNSIIEIAQKLKKQGKNLEEILFLAPTKSGEYGTDKINHILRPIFLEKQNYINDLPLCIGDPIITIKNDYIETAERRKYLYKIRHPNRDIDIFNGTRGKILAWHENIDTVEIEYFTPDGHITVPYTTEEILAWIDVAYGLTVHKAQGSEANHVVFIKPINLKNRNMIYTAATRAKENLYLLGKNWTEAVARPSRDPYTKFMFRVQDHLSAKNAQLIPEVAATTTEKSLFKRR